ncbi:hypothetical protein PC110_g18931, partial [Phytophthora cactorum]
MVLRYKRIRDDVRQVKAVEEHVPTGAAHKKLMGRLEHLKKLDSVCKTLQDEGTSMAGVSLLFDQVTDDYLAMASYLQTNAKIVHTPVFEAVLVKIANDSKLTTAEARAVERFVVEPSTSTGKKKERSSDNYANEILRGGKQPRRDGVVAASYSDLAKMTFKLVAVRLASASASVELPIRQSSLAAAHVDVVREEDVEDVRLGGWQEPRVLQVSEVAAGQVAVGEADGGTAGQEGVAGRGSRVVCEEVVEGAQLDELRARPVQKETKLIAVRLASSWTSAWTSMALLVKQSVLAVSSVVWLMQPLTRRDR